jgi:UDP-glucose 4-epimerase
MNVLVIGGNGFIGSHITDRLLASGHKVRVFDLYKEKYREPLPDVDYRLFKLENIPDLYEAMLGIDVVFHLASASVPSTSNVDQIADVNANLIPTLNILNVMQKLNIPKIVYFSSGGAVYGNSSKELIDEDEPLKPISSYGIIKLTIEQYILLYNRLFGLDYLIVRPSNPYGPRQGHFVAQGVISTFLRKAHVGESLSVYGDGSSTKDYIYIKDFSAILVKLVEAQATGIFNIGSGTGTSLNTIIKLVSTLCGKVNDVVYHSQNAYDVKNFILDIERVKRTIGTFELTSIEAGMKETWDWIKKVH